MNKHPLVAAILAEIPTREARFSEMRAYDQGVKHAADVLEKKIVTSSFGWIIRRSYDDLGETHHQYLSKVLIPDNAPTQFLWANSRHNSELFPTDFKDAVLLKLGNADPTITAVELFWS